MPISTTFAAKQQSSKAATDGKRDGIDYHALLGHSTRAMSYRYIKLEDAQVVEPMRKVL